MLVLVPERRTGVVVLANSNTVPATAIATAALDIALADHAFATRAPAALGEGVATMRALLPPVVGPVAATLKTSGPDAAAAAFHRLAAVEPAAFDVTDDGFTAAVWGAIELHRSGLVWPLLRLWTDLRPGSPAAWTMTGWAHQVDGENDLARLQLRRALELDPDNEDAAQLLSVLPPAG
jgi:Flp pilus assembly protein TadD